MVDDAKTPADDTVAAAIAAMGAAAGRGDVDAVRRFLDAGADADALGPAGQAALHAAAAGGYAAVVALLLDRGADPDVRAGADDDGATPWSWPRPAVAAAASYVVHLAGRTYIRHRFAARAAGLAAETACPGCGADDAAPVARAGTVRYPGCGRQTSAFKFVGKS